MGERPNPFDEMYQREQKQKRAEEEEARRRGRPVPQRIAPLLGTVDAGEIVVGAERTVDLGSIIVIDGYPGGGTVLPRLAVPAGPRAPDGVLSPNPDGFFIEDALYGTPLNVAPGSPRAIRAVFRPQVAGTYRSEFAFRVMWQDGSYTEQVVILKGKARGLDDVPASAKMDHLDPATSSRDDPQLKKAPTLDADVTSIEAAANSARDSVDTIADSQRDGVTLAEKEALSFIETPPEPSILAILADVAISMGVAGIAGVLARSAARHLAGMKIKDIKERNDSSLTLGATDSFKEGIKGLTKSFVAPTIAKPGKAEPTKPGTTRTLSSNPTIDFWTHQRSQITALKKGFRDVVSKSQVRAKAMAPETGLLFMQALARSLHESGHSGEILLTQALASETQWMSAIAQSSTGVSIAHDPERGDMMTSDLSWLRREPKFALRDGVVRISVDASSGAPVVRSAKLKGISQEIADRMWRHPLVHVPIPVVLEVHDAARTTRITRDEAGRVRAQSEILLPGEEPTESEPRMIGDAMQVVETVLSRSLADWGIAPIETNDATGREK